MKKIISLSLALVMLMGIMTGCGKTPSTEEPLPNEPVEQQRLPEIPTPNIETPEKEEPQQEENLNVEMNITNIGFNAFDSELIEYLHADKATENYMVSPLSFRYAMALATAGAAGETQQELLESMGFSSMEEYLKWTTGINNIEDQFEADLARDIEDFKNYGYGDSEPSRALKVANSIWHNIDDKGTIKEEYINYTKDNFGAVASDVTSDKIVDTVNNWVDEQTNGMIPSLLPADANQANTILVNTLYMKSAWINTFNKSTTKKGDFTTIDGDKVKKDLMFNQSKYKYYEDENTQIVILPMDGGINMAIVLGDNTNISEKLNNVTSEEVIVQLPKFEVETSFDKKELINYLNYKGVDLALRPDGGADFSPMIEDVEIHIDDIIQKTKIKVDEEGTEAAAATAVIMVKNTAMFTEPKEPKKFIANKPFTYYIYTEGETDSELLFFGQYVK